MAKNGDQIEKIFSHNTLKNDLYAISITKKFKKLISKGFFMNIILEIMVVMVVMVVVNIRNSKKEKQAFLGLKKTHGSHGRHGRRNI